MTQAKIRKKELFVLVCTIVCYFTLMFGISSIVGQFELNNAIIPNKFIKKLPYFLLNNDETKFSIDIFLYYFLSIMVIFIFHVCMCFFTKLKKYILFTFLLLIVLAPWLLGLDGRTIKLSSFLIGEFNSAIEYCLFIPTTHFFMLWMFKVFELKKSVGEKNA
jgi:hypothetical protein